MACVRPLFAAISLGLLIVAASAEVPPLPATPKRTVTEVFHGVEVRDDYAWLQKANDPEVRRWIEDQNQHTRAILDQFPQMSALRQRVRELMSEKAPDYRDIRYQGSVLFALKLQPPQEQRFLITLASPEQPESARVIVDPNAFRSPQKTAIDFYVPSRNGRLVAVSLSEGGSEEGSVHVYDVDSGKERGDVIPRVNGPTAGGSVAWNADNTGFYYTRYPRGDERPKEDLDFYQQVYFHKLGTPTESDTYVIGKEFPRIAEITLDASSDGRYVLATVANGDGGEYAHYLRSPDGRWTKVTEFADRISAAIFGPGESLYLVSRKGAPRGKIMRLPLEQPKLATARVVVPQSDVNIEGMTLTSAGGLAASLVATATRLYVIDVNGGPSQLRVFDPDGGHEQKVPIKPVSAVEQIVRMEGDEVLFRNESYVDPPAWYRYDPATAKVTITALRRDSRDEFRDVEVVREFATAKDGTKVPLTILHRKGRALDGKNPTLLYGYGGFGISITPSFRLGRLAWLEQGGVSALANLRGGGEYGEEWRAAGQLTRKQNVFDDFAACARHLIERKYTTPEKLAIEGGSNGGLLMGAELTQHPALFRAVVAHVGLYDMLRFERHPNGVFIVTEYGSVKDPEQFKALLAYSPYEQVKESTAYPAVFLLCGINDGRVAPADSWKMAARLQTATSSGRPVLLWTKMGSGHGIGSSLSEKIDEATDVYAFLFQQLGVKYTPVR
jgi:prolyl oligopeptidase